MKEIYEEFLNFLFSLTADKKSFKIAGDEIELHKVVSKD